MFVTLIIPLVLTFVLVRAYENGREYSVRCTSSCTLVEGRLNSPDSNAYGTYVDTVDTDGWGKLWVHGDGTLNGWYQAGFLEGSLTSERIYQHYISWYDYQFGKEPLTEETKKFMMDQYDYAIKLATKKSNQNDPYYQTLNKLLSQFQGILDGQNQAATSPEHKLSLMDLLLLEAAGDLYDIIPATNPVQYKLHIGKLSPLEFFDRWHNQISCSALIKINDDKSDVFVAHTAWTSYQNMLRIYKHYDLDNGRYLSSHSSKPGNVHTPSS